MKKKAIIGFFVLGFFIAVILLTGGCGENGEETEKVLGEADFSAAKALEQRFVDAMSNKDLDGVMACFWDSPDLVVILSGTVLRGTDAVRASIEQMFAQNESVKLTVNESFDVAAGDGIITVGTATYDLQPAGDGEPIQLVERWSDLKQKIDGRWVYVLDHVTIVPKQEIQSKTIPNK